LTIDPSSILRSQQWSIAPALDKSKTVLEPLHQTPREKSKAARTVNVATGTPVSSSATSPRSRLRRHPSDAVHFPGVYMSIHGSDWASRDALWQQNAITKKAVFLSLLKLCCEYLFIMLNPNSQLAPKGVSKVLLWNSWRFDSHRSNWARELTSFNSASGKN